MKKPQFAVLEFEQLAPGGCFNVDFGPDGRTVIGLNTDGSIATWDAQTGKILQRKQVKRSGPQLSRWTSPDRLKFFVRIDSRTVIFDTQTLEENATLPFDAYAVTWNGSDELMATVDSSGNVRVLNAADHREIATIKLRFCESFVAFLGDGTELITQQSGIISTWNYRTGKMINRVRLKKVRWRWEHALSEDGKTLVSVCKIGLLTRTDTTTWKSKTFQVPGEPTTCSLTPDGKRAAMISNKDVLIWDLVEDSLWLKWKKPNYRFVCDGAFSPDGQRFVCTPDYQVHVIDFRPDAKEHLLQRAQPKPGEHQCLEMVGGDERMDLERGYGEPLNPLPIKCPQCKMPDLDFVGTPYRLGRKIDSPADMAQAEAGNFLVRDSMKRVLDLVAPGQCKFYPTINSKTQQPTPWLLAVPEHLQVTGSPPENRERCPKCGEPWSFHHYSECADRRSWASPFSTHEVFKSKNWSSDPVPFRGWQEARPDIYGRMLYFSVRLETLIKKLRLKGMVRSSDCKEVPTPEDLAWVKEKILLLNQAGAKASISKTPSQVTDWFKNYLKMNAKKKPVVHDFAAIEKKHRVKLPETYKNFISKAGTKTFKDVDEEEGFSVHILPPNKLNFKEYRKPAAGEDEEQGRIDGVMFATTDHGDVFCFDVSAKSRDFPVYHFKHETDEFEPYAENFAACIRRFAGA